MTLRGRALAGFCAAMVVAAAAGGAAWWYVGHRPEPKPVAVWDRRLPPGTRVLGPTLATSPDGRWFVLVWAEGRRIHWLRGSDARGTVQLDAPGAIADTTYPFSGFSDEFAPRAAVDVRGQVALAWMTRPMRRNEGAAIALARPDLMHDGRTDLTLLEGHDPAGFLVCQSILYDDDGSLAAVWIDAGRPEKSVGEVGHLQAAVAGPQGAFDRVLPLADSVCSCCRTALAWLGPERLALAYRGVGAMNERDVRFAIFRLRGADGSDSPALVPGSNRTVSEDGWKLEGCPSQGPSVAPAGEGAAWVAWSTEGEAHGKGVHLARVVEGGTRTARGPDGAGGARGAGGGGPGAGWWAERAFNVDPRNDASRPSVATLSSGRPVVAYEGPTPEGGRALYWRTLREAGLTPPQRTTGTSRALAPSLERWGRDGVLLGWRESDASGERVVLARMNGFW